MTSGDKQKYKAQAQMISGLLQAAKAGLGGPIPPVPSMPPGVPLPLTPAFGPLQASLRMQADAIEKLIKLVNDVIEAS